MGVLTKALQKTKKRNYSQVQTQIYISTGQGIAFHGSDSTGSEGQGVTCRDPAVSVRAIKLVNNVCKGLFEPKLTTAGKQDLKCSGQ